MNIPEAKNIKSIEDVREFFKFIGDTFNVLYHPEDRWEDYDLGLPEDEIQQLNDAVDMCWEIADAADEDLCEIAMEVYTELGLVGSIGGE